MENPLINTLTWFAIQLYSNTFSKIPPVIFDIDTSTNPKRVQLVLIKPKWFKIPWLTLYIVNTSLLIIGTPVALLQMFDSKNQTTTRILTTSIVILHWFVQEYVLSSLRTLWQASHCVPYINFLINNQLPHRKYSYPLLLLILTFCHDFWCNVT